MPQLPREQIDLARRLKVSPEHLTISKSTELTAAQRAGLLKVDIPQLSLPIILTPNRPQIGPNFLSFTDSILVSSGPYTFTPDTGGAYFGPSSANAFVEIGFVPIKANKPHLIEITTLLLNFDKGPASFQFHTKMFTGLNPIPEKDFSLMSDQPIVLLFPALTQGLTDNLRIVHLIQKTNLAPGSSWAFCSVKITSVL